MQKYSALSDFLSSYFHQDWKMEADAPEGVVDLFVSSESPAEVQLVVSDLDDLLSSENDESRLMEILLKELGCYYYPPADGYTARQWLDLVRSRLVRSLMR